MIRHAIVPAYLAACLLLGGASAAGHAANLMLQLTALPLIGWSLWRLAQRRDPAMDGWATPAASRALLWLLAAMIVLVLLQLLPLPPGLWTGLNGREGIATNFRLLGITLPWLPLSLAPTATVASALWLLPAIGALLATVVLGAFRGVAVASVIVGVALAAVALGVAQRVGGGGAAYIYDVTNVGQAVGFFANANHNATLLLIALPFTAALASALVTRSESQRSTAAVRMVAGAAFAVIAVGLVINGSLAGLGLGVPVAMASWLAFGRLARTARRWLFVAAAAASVAGLVGVSLSDGNNLVGGQQANAELSRRTSLALTWQATRAYLPWGSGIGSFQPVYRTQEPLAQVTTTYMNHAHSDWLELLLETGLPGALLALAFLGWWVWRVRAIWRAATPEPWARAAAIATAAVMAHSLVDYPLRTAALSALFATALALMAGARAYRRLSREAPARHLSV